MTAYGTCHKCGRATGCDPYGGEPIPQIERDAKPQYVHRGRYDSSTKLWECLHCDEPEIPPQCRQPSESRQQFRARMRKGILRW